MSFIGCDGMPLYVYTVPVDCAAAEMNVLFCAW